MFDNAGAAFAQTARAEKMINDKPDAAADELIAADGPGRRLAARLTERLALLVSPIRRESGANVSPLLTVVDNRFLAMAAKDSLVSGNAPRRGFSDLGEHLAAHDALRPLAAINCCRLASKSTTVDR